MELLLANAVLATLFAGAVAVAAVAVRRPAFASRAWLLVLLKFVVPPLVFVPLIRPTASVPPVNLVGAGLPRPNAAEAMTDIPVATGDEGGETPPLPTIPPDSVVEAPRWSWSATGLAVWLAGSCAYWALAAVRLARFYRVARNAADATPEVADDVVEAARAVGLRRPVRVRWLDAAVSPFALGRSTVFLPRGLWARLGRGGRVAVLAHELAHLARGDAWTRRLELAAVGLYWWLPVAWWARRARRVAEEACCDECVVRALPHLAGEYASALVEAAAYVSRPLAVPLACGGAARGADLRRRVTMILTPSSERRRPWAAAVLLIGLAALALPLRPGWADDPPADPPTPEVPATPAEPAPPALPATAAVPAKVALPAVPTTPAVPPVRANVNDLRDEVDLLTARLELNRTKLIAAKRFVEVAVDEHEMTKKLRASGQGTDSEYRRAGAQIEKARAELAEAEYQVKATEIQLRQAKRRLGEAATPVVPPAVTKPRPVAPVPAVTTTPAVAAPAAPARFRVVPDNRVDIERRIKQLQDELDELKKLLAKARPANDPTK